MLERDSSAGGVWHSQANVSSRVNTSEAAYRLANLGSLTNFDHTPTYQIMDDVNSITSLYLRHRIKFGALVHGIRADNNAHAICHCDVKKRILAAQISLLGINRRLGALRHLHFADEHRFQGALCYGVENEITYVDLDSTTVLIVGAGAFAAENVRTTFERGVDRVTVVQRR